MTRPGTRDQGQGTREQRQGTREQRQGTREQRQGTREQRQGTREQRQGKDKPYAVALVRLVKTASKGWVRRPFALGTTRNWEARLDRNLAAFGPDAVDLGDYCLRWYENQCGVSKVKYQAVGPTYVEAARALAERVARLALIAAAREAGIALELPAAGQPTLQARLEKFLRARRATDKLTSPKTAYIYEHSLRQFTAATGVRTLERVTGETLEKFLVAMRERGLSDRSRYNLYGKLATFLRWSEPKLGPTLTALSPAVAAKDPQSYAWDEVETLLEYLRWRPRNQVVALAVEMFAKTGLREKELTHLSWSMVDLQQGLISIRDGQRFEITKNGQATRIEFRTKTRRDRSIRLPLEPGLLERLKAWRLNNPGAQFVFGNKAGNPHSRILGRIKIAAHRAGLSCGACDACRRPCGECKECRCNRCLQCQTGRRCIRPHRGERACTRVQCAKWTQHRFRHTFATHAVKSGVDLKTLMDWLGHSNLRTTQKYLSVTREAEAQAALRKMFPSSPATA